MQIKALSDNVVFTMRKPSLRVEHTRRKWQEALKEAGILPDGVLTREHYAELEFCFCVAYTESVTVPDGAHEEIQQFKRLVDQSLETDPGDTLAVKALWESRLDVHNQAMEAWTTAALKADRDLIVDDPAQLPSEALSDQQKVEAGQPGTPLAKKEKATPTA